MTNDNEDSGDHPESTPKTGAGGMEPPPVPIKVEKDHVYNDIPPETFSETRRDR